MPEVDSRLWAGMLAHLRASHPTVCRQWFEEIEAMGVGAGALNLRAQTDLHRDYLRKQCGEAFNDALRSVSGQLLPVRFLGPRDEAPGTRAKGGARSKDPAPQARPAPAPMPPIADPSTPGTLASRQWLDGLVVNPDYGFENFVVGPGNRLAAAAAKAVAANPGRAYNPFFIHGGVGLGKTHLLQAICLEIARATPAVRFYYISCESFVTQFMSIVQQGEMTEFRHRFRDVDVLVIDDIHFLAKLDRTQEEFFHTFNSLYQSNRQIILSSDAAPEEIPLLEARLVSRFKWGLVTELATPCYETRVAIVQTKARLRGITITDDAARFIASRIDTNIRELEGAIVKLQIQSSVENRPVDLDMARQSLGEAKPQGLLAEPTIQTIMNAVTGFYGVRLADLQSKRRQRSVAHPRQVCMYLARKHTRMSLEEIGGYFGGRDHTTVMHAVRIVESRRRPDADLDNILKTLEERIRPGRPQAADSHSA